MPFVIGLFILNYITIDFIFPLIAIMITSQTYDNNHQIQIMSLAKLTWIYNSNNQKAKQSLKMVAVMLVKISCYFPIILIKWTMMLLTNAEEDIQMGLVVLCRSHSLWWFCKVLYFTWSCEPSVGSPTPKFHTSYNQSISRNQLLGDTDSIWWAKQDL